MPAHIAPADNVTTIDKTRHQLNLIPDRGALGAAAAALLLLLSACAGALPGTSNNSDGRSDATAVGTPPHGSPYRQSRAEFILLVADCLRLKGYAVDVDPEQSAISFDGVTDQEKATADREECVEGIDPRRLDPPPELTDDQLRAFYAYRFAEANCLREAGYPVGEAVPEQVYIDSGGRWDAYESLIAQEVHVSHEDQVRCANIEQRPDFLDW